MLETVRTIDFQEYQVKSVQQDIHRVIDQLPLESLKTLQQFAAFLQQQASNERTPTNGRKRLELVTVPASQLTGLIGLLSPGYEGNALEDTEALYDDV